jgi:hypothetical protein
MSQRYRKSVAAVMTSEPETSNGYSTRNKRRKLNEMPSPPTIPRPTIKSFDIPHSSKIPRGTVEAIQSRHSPMYSRNLDKALKSILSESPRLRNSRGEETSRESVEEVTPSVEDEGGSSSAVVIAQGNGGTSSISLSSQQSRETTPSSSLGGQIVDIPPFIEFFQKEREAGGISKETRSEAVKMLQEWRSEWQAEDKRIRELKRKIKSFNVLHVDVPPPTPPIDVKSRARSTSSRAPANGSKPAETPKAIETDTAKSSVASPSVAGRVDSVTGPNGLTGSYWDISMSEMGRGNRRKSKT